MMTEWLTRLRFLLFRKSQSEFENELQFHIEQSIAAKVAAGIPETEARRQAKIEFGGVEKAREQVYEQGPGVWMEIVLRDVRYALRGFLRAPGFFVTAVVTLALAIGATTAVFSVVDRILFRSLPYAHDDRIVSVGFVQSLEHQEFMLGSFFFDWRDNQKPFDAFAAQSTYSHACDLVETNPTQLACLRVQAGYLPLFGIAPVLGRNFTADEDRPDAPAVAIISYGLWKSRYGSDRGILNRLIEIDGNPVRVIGVLPKTFIAPTLEPTDVVLPMGLDEMQERAAKPGSPMRVFARLRPGVTLAQAQAELQPLFLRTQQMFPPGIRNDFHLSVRSLRDREAQEMKLTAWVLLGSVLAVLLIACANLASLMMARGAIRQREFAMRSALGASRIRLVRQTMTEAMLLSLAGAVPGVLLAEGLLRIFIAIAPAGIPFLGHATIDLRIAFFTLLLALACGFFFGILPALQRPGSIAHAAHTPLTGRHAFLRRLMVAGQIAIGLVLLSAASLLMRSFQKMQEQKLGMDTGGVLTIRISLPASHYDSDQKKMEFYLEAENAIRRIPGIEAVGWSDSFPPGGWNSGRRFSDFAVAGRPQTPPGTGGPVVTRQVTPDYFRALDIPIFRGRGFTEADRRKVAALAANLPSIQGQHLGQEQGDPRSHELILSKLMAARLFHGNDPIGQHIRIGTQGAWSTVVGVADDVKNNGLTGEDVPEIYFLRQDAPEDWGGRVALDAVTGGGGPVMVVKTALASGATVGFIRAQITHLDPTVPLAIEPLTAHVRTLASLPRFETALLSFFAACGLTMAVIGLYGVIAFLTTQRTQEIGVRMALGADRMDILLLIAGEGVRLIALGGVLGLAASITAAQLLKSLLFHVGPHDPASFFAVSALLALVAFAAILIPARAAMKVEPVVALRCD